MTATLAKLSATRSAKALWWDSTVRCSPSVLRSTAMVMAPAAQTSSRSRTPRRQFTRSDSGSITARATKDAQFSRKKDSHSAAMPLAASSMILSSRPEWVTP